MIESEAQDVDVLIVGGGPAGLSAALACHRRGIACMVVDAQLPGTDKACGEGLVPSSVHALSALGVKITAEDGHSFRGIRFSDDKYSVDANFSSGIGIGVRRTQLHSMLAQRVQQRGISVRWNSRVKLLRANVASVEGQELRYRYLIGADGQSSTVRKWAGLEACRSESLRYGFRQHYQVAPWSDFAEVHWGAGGQFYITPVSAECVCAVFISRDARAGRENPLSQFPKLQQRLAGAQVLSQPRGGVSATRKLRRVANDFVALIGDASGSADSITGEGLAMCFQHAEAVADAIARGSLESYPPAHARIGRLPHTMGRLMLLMDRWPALGSRAMHALASSPTLFQELLSVHGGETSFLQFLVQRGPQVSWNLLAAPMRSFE